MQITLYEKVSTILKFLKKNKVEVANWLDYTVTKEQTNHNFNLIKNNPNLTLEGFQTKAIIQKDDDTEYE